MLSNINLLKSLCAFLVILIHILTPYTSKYMPILRMAVPCFFIISGFFMSKSDSEQSTIKRMKKTFNILLWAVGLYFILWSWLYFSYNYVSMDWLNIESLKNFLLFNEIHFGFHLWYVAAYLYVLIIWLGFQKIKKTKWLAHVAPIFSLVGIACSTYSIYTLKAVYELFYFRNFLFVGLPFFSVGYLIGLYEERVRNFMSKKQLICAVLLLVVGTLAEDFFVRDYGTKGVGDLNFSVAFLAIAVFCLFLKLDVKENVFTKIGQYDSLYLYILHPGVSWLITLFVTIYGYLNVYQNLGPVIVVFASLVLTHVLRRVGIFEGKSFFLNTFASYHDYLDSAISFLRRKSVSGGLLVASFFIAVLDLVFFAGNDSSGDFVACVLLLSLILLLISVCVRVLPFYNKKLLTEEGQLHLMWMFVFFMLILGYHSTFNYGGDDLSFMGGVSEGSFADFVKSRCVRWTSCSLIDVYQIVITHSDIWLWRVLDSFMLLVVIESFLYLFIPQKNGKFSVLAYMLVLFFLPKVLNVESWASTSMNYIWPMAAFCGLLVIFKTYLNKSVSFSTYVYLVIFTLFAADNEYIIAIMLALPLLYLLYVYFAEKITPLSFFMSNRHVVVMIVIALTSFIVRQVATTKSSTTDVLKGTWVVEGTELSGFTLKDDNVAAPYNSIYNMCSWNYSDGCLNLSMKVANTDGAGDSSVVIVPWKVKFVSNDSLAMTLDDVNIASFKKLKK